MAKSKHYRVAKKHAKKHAKKEEGLFIPHHKVKKTHRLLTALFVLVFVKGLLLGKLCHKHHK